MVSAPAVRAPAPVAAPVSPQAMQQFNELKRGLGELVSWELTGNDYEVLSMSFTEAGNEQQAKAFAAVLK